MFIVRRIIPKLIFLLLLSACSDSGDDNKSSFKLSLLESTVKLIQGESTNIAVNLEKQNGFDASVQLELTGNTNGITAVFSPNPTSDSSTLALSIDASANVGERTLTIKGNGGGKEATANITLIIEKASNNAGSFSLGLEPTTIGVTQGKTANITVNIVKQNGFSAPVQLELTGDTDGITASFSPNSTSDSSTLALSIDASANVGERTLTIKGNGGGKEATANITLTIEKASNNAGSFSLELQPNVIVLTPGGSTEVDVKLMRTGGFAAPVNLSLSGFPNDLTASLGESSVAGNSTTLSITTTTVTDAADVQFTISGTADGKVQEVKAQLSVQIPDHVSGGEKYAYAPGVSGEERSIEINGEEIRYQVIDGLAIFQGDIVLGNAKVFEERAKKGELVPTTGTCRGNYLFGCGRWSNGTIGYRFADNWGDADENERMRGLIEDAMDEWKARTSINFVERSSGRLIEFRNGPGCSSGIGRVEITGFDVQSVSLNNSGCGNFLDVIMHEIGHAIGLYHEHARNDRGSFVRILPENIQDGAGTNFWKYSILGEDVGEYDYASIMHYDCTTFSRDGSNTIEPIRPGVSCDDLNLGVLTEGDILGVYWLYRPTVAIVGVTNGATLARNMNQTLALSFTGEAVDPSFIRWSSNRITDLLGSGRGISLPLWTLPDGSHTITASVVINGVQVAASSVNITLENVAPTVNIFAPIAGEEFCSDQNIIFKATVRDIDTFPEQTLPPESLSWRVGSETSFATGTTVSRSFSLGAHTVTATATDEQGARGSDSISINVVNCTQEPPTATISNPPARSGSGPDLDVSPTTSDVNGFFHQITLQGSAIDPEDGTLSGESLVWTTNKADVQPGGPSSGKQELGTGTSATVKLYTTCTGTYFGTVDHLITLTAKDSGEPPLTSTVTRIVRVRTLC